MHKILYGGVPEYISRKFSYQTFHYRTRKSDYSLCIPRVKTNYGKRRLEYRGAIAWNNLTNDLKGTMSIFSFRKQLFCITPNNNSTHIFCFKTRNTDSYSVVEIATAHAHNDKKKQYKT